MNTSKPKTAASSGTSRRMAVESAYVRRRDRQHDLQQRWQRHSDYFTACSRANSQLDAWTSDAFYAASQEQYSKARAARLKADRLEERRARLTLLLHQENTAHEAEVKRRPVPGPGPAPAPATAGHQPKPTSVLKELQQSLQTEQADRQRRQAELQLYHKWRADSRALRDYEAGHERSALKLAWLDQQVERRMAEEAERLALAEEARQRDLRLQQDLAAEEERRQADRQRSHHLLHQLDQQLEQLRLKEQRSDQLQRLELEEMQRLARLDEAAAQAEKMRQRSAAVEVQEFNVRQAKARLRARQLQVEQELQQQQELAQRLVLEQQELDEKKGSKQEDTSIEPFLRLAQQHRAVEQQRKQHLSALFDSEAAQLLQQQEQCWRAEQAQRDGLLQQVLAGLRRQVEQRQAERQAERQAIAEDRRRLEDQLRAEDQQERQRAEDQQRQQRADLRKQLELREAEKELAARQEKLQETQQREEELHRLQREEDKIRAEIVDLQRRQGRHHHQQHQHQHKRILW